MRTFSYPLGTTKSGVSAGALAGLGTRSGLLGGRIERLDVLFAQRRRIPRHEPARIEPARRLIRHDNLAAPAPHLAEVADRFPSTLTNVLGKYLPQQVQLLACV